MPRDFFVRSGVRRDDRDKAECCVIEDLRWIGLMSKPIPQIPSATIERHHFWLKPHEWKKIEKAYGRPINFRLRRKIELATETFLTYREIEQTAAPVAEVRQRIARACGGCGRI